MKTTKIGYVGLTVAGFLLCSCAAREPVVLDSAHHQEILGEDFESLYPAIDATSGQMDLTISDAIDRALRYNLDGRVAALETIIAQDNVSLAQFEGAPEISAAGTFTRRSNQEVVSMDNADTGVQSVPPSTASDRVRRLADIEAKWNIVDSVIAYLEGKNAQDDVTVAKERLRKVQHNIESDVIGAYWQAYAGQKLEQDISQLSQDIARIEAAVHTAMGQKLLSASASDQKITNLLAQQRRLNELYEATSISKATLKSIAALPYETDIHLKTRPDEFNNEIKKLLENKSVNQFIEKALQHRPEMREAFMNTNMTARGIERELLKTFPGLNIIYSLSYDSNDYLRYNQWNDFSAGITQSLSDFISLPTRYRAAQNRDVLEVNKRKALMAAIVTQVHMARIRVNLAEANYNLVKSEYDMMQKRSKDINARKKEGTASGYDDIIAKTGLIAKDIELQQAHAAMQKAYIDMIGTMGYSLSEFTSGETS